MTKIISIVGVLLLLGSWVLGERGTDQVVALSARTEWSFALSAVEDVRRSDEGPSVLGLMLDVSAEGEIELLRIMRASGEARVCRTPRVDGRLYRWELRDALGVPIREGEHFDRTEQFTVSEDGACESQPIGRHAMLIRVPGDTEAQTLALIQVDVK